MAKQLRHGYTTGACAAAAAKGAALMLRDQRLIAAVELALPAGFSATFQLRGQGFDSESARCFVVKDAGDDPDVTHGVEVHATVALVRADSAEVLIEGGVGIGRVTKPGLAVAVGEWAINPVPRRMIEAALAEVLPGRALRVVLSIPDGVERAERTLNARLGILGGLSILGTSGVVRPISHKAWTDTLEVALDVALAAGCSSVVLATGRSSELAAQQQLGLAEEAYIEMGDHVGYALEASHRRGFSRIVLAAQFAKLVKIACGHPQTHVHSSSMDLQQLARWGRRLGLDDAASKQIECANTAREVFVSHPEAAILIAEVARQALEQMEMRAPGAKLEILLVDYAGGLAGHFVKGSGA